MKVVFALRADALEKPGGDTSKVRRYAEGLERFGWQTETVVSKRALSRSNPDIVHILNLDLPLENSALAKAATRLNVPVVISTICHPFAGLVGMYESGDDAFYRLCRKLGFSAERSASLRERLKLIRRGNVSAAATAGNFRAAQQRLLSRSAAILPMAEGEMAYLKSHFDICAPVRLVRNGVSFQSPSQNFSSSSQFDIVTVGRIEPRKNSLALARAAKQAGLSVLFVGALNPKHGAYCAEFEAVVSGESAFVHKGSVPHNQLPELLASAHTYINPAWFEVVSQADVEAASSGLRIATTRHGYAEDALGDELLRLDPAELHGSGGSEYLQKIMEGARKVTAIRERDWEECAAELDEIYTEILGKSGWAA